MIRILAGQARAPSSHLDRKQKVKAGEDRGPEEDRTCGGGIAIELNAARCRETFNPLPIGFQLRWAGDESARPTPVAGAASSPGGAAAECRIRSQGERRRKKGWLESAYVAQCAFRGGRAVDGLGLPRSVPCVNRSLIQLVGDPTEAVPLLLIFYFPPLLFSFSSSSPSPFSRLSHANPFSFSLVSY